MCLVDNDKDFGIAGLCNPDMSHAEWAPAPPRPAPTIMQVTRTEITHLPFRTSFTARIPRTLIYVGAHHLRSEGALMSTCPAIYAVRLCITPQHNIKP